MLSHLFALIVFGTIGGVSEAQMPDLQVRERLTQAVQSEVSGWAMRAVATHRDREIYRWTKDQDQRTLQIIVRRFVDKLDARAAFDETVAVLSVGSTTLKNVGDAAVKAGVPGGFQNIYVLVDTVVVHLSVPASIKSDERLAAAVARQLTGQ